jgi:REP-associated tyrosine transposase
VITNRPKRLNGVDYCGFRRYFLTICTAHRRTIFESSEAVDPVLQKLLEISSSNGFSIPAYCFMPDHVHALIEGLVENADFRYFVKAFKQVTAFDYRRRNGSDLWQPGYHERIVRDDEATEAIVRYIWGNPISAGITKQLGEYPFCGSDRYELSDILDAWQGNRRT